jgi:large subunit ribosomal protein L10
MALNLSQKQEVVAELADVAAKAHSLVAAEYAGTTVSQMTAMRKKARETGVYLRVVKNTLASRAVAGTEFEVVKDSLVGPLLYAFSTEEPGAAGRLIKEFAKGNDKLQAKVVAVGGQQYPATHVEVLASLPTRDQALAMLARVLAEPAAMFARAVKAVADKQGGGDVVRTVGVGVDGHRVAERLARQGNHRQVAPCRRIVVAHARTETELDGVRAGLCHEPLQVRELCFR